MIKFVATEALEPHKELEQVISLLQSFITRLNKKMDALPEQDTRLVKFSVWAKGLKFSLEELYASYEAAHYYRQYIKSTIVNEMNVDEQKGYAYYVYYDKNGFIRVFSLLDKLGTFLNELLMLKTERVKPHYSFFTVLRTLRERQLHPLLTNPLNEIKEASKESTIRLRKRRNTEIHYMNSEMEDDLIQETRMFGQDVRLENLDQQQKDLYVGLVMNITAIKLTFQYADKLIFK